MYVPGRSRKDMIISWVLAGYRSDKILNGPLAFLRCPSTIILSSLSVRLSSDKAAKTSLENLVQRKRHARFSILCLSVLAASSGL